MPVELAAAIAEFVDREPAREALRRRRAASPAAGPASPRRARAAASRRLPATSSGCTAPIRQPCTCRCSNASSDFTTGDLDAALYERRSLVRLLGMRRTMFVVPLDLAAEIDAVVHEGARRAGAPSHRATHRGPGHRRSRRPRRATACAATLAAAARRRAATGPRIDADRVRAATAGAARRGQARTRHVSRSPTGSSCSCRSKATSCALARSGRGCRASTGGRRRSAGSPTHCRSSAAAEARTELRAPVVAHVRTGDDHRHRLVGEVDEASCHRRPRRARRRRRHRRTGTRRTTGTGMGPARRRRRRHH